MFYLSRKNGNDPEKQPFDKKDFIHTILEGIPALIMPIFIVAFVSFGICTGSESAGIAVLYALLIGFF